MRTLIWLTVAAALAVPTDSLADSLTRRRADPKLTYSVPIGGSPVRGPTDALVTVVTACDFGSPFCRRIRATLDQLLSLYEGDLRVVYKQFVVYKTRTVHAALAACAAHRQGHFYEMESVIWTQTPRTKRDFLAEDMHALADELGLDMRQFKADMGKPCEGVLAADRALLERVGVRGAPASFVNGRFLAGSQPFRRFQQVIDEELTKARARVVEGVKRTNYYGEYVVARGEREAARYQPPPRRRPRRDDVRARVRRRPDPKAVYAVAVGKSPVRGPADAKVTMVLGCQFAGPFCRRIQATLSQLRADYGDDLRIVYKHFVVYRARALPPALAACAAHRQGKYFEMDAFLWGEAYDNRTWNAVAMRGYAERIGLDMKRYDKDVKNTCPDVIKADRATLQRVGARGTPNAFINGRFIGGARPIGQFKTLIDEELARANAVIKNRKQQKRYYQKHVLGKGKKEL